jgi:hypothetical protein
VRGAHFGWFELGHRIVCQVLVLDGLVQDRTQVPVGELESSRTHTPLAQHRELEGQHRRVQLGQDDVAQVVQDGRQGTLVGGQGRWSEVALVEPACRPFLQGNQGL